MTKIESAWEILRRAEDLPISESLDGVRLRNLQMSAEYDFYAGLDREDRAIIAFGFDARPELPALGRGALDSFRLRRANGKWLLLLRVQSKSIESVFARLGTDLIGEVISLVNEDVKGVFITERIELWQRLFLSGIDGILEDRRVRGLFAELSFLDSLVRSHERSVSDCVSAWVGPARADQDFVFHDKAYEIKSVLPGRDSVKISSLSQLQARTPLELVVMNIAEVPEGAQGGTTLNELVARLERIIAHDVRALAIFRMKLLEAGYVSRLEYDARDLYVQDLRRFDVSQDFPRLTSSSVPDGVLAAQYDLVLAALERFRLSA
ncbi:hypothetical protein FHT39_000517 [Mitsuaria sp. BK045]|uniref:PD-(D/E)XK motif protein n=1 Tax=unclassified Roseateles TaxID=2626991 RepID=UPI00160ACB72|nr:MULTISPECIES: PD-(D/E)XK motif protein [unclassified Roseateles]MBB3291878.1 hypothetical protein [Mitsuaria sp. BK041]MBB3361095.1 hypothetical protein [Mitsuaria sp. BK045]